MNPMPVTATLASLGAVLAQQGVPDWNWFYSTLAQSTAALVGILCAFGISRLIGNQALEQSIRGRIDSFLAQAVSLQAHAGRLAFGDLQRRQMTCKMERVALAITRSDSVFDVEAYLGNHPAPAFCPAALFRQEIEKAACAYTSVGHENVAAFVKGYEKPAIAARCGLDGLQASAEELALQIEDHITSLIPILRDVLVLNANRGVVLSCLAASVLLYLFGVLVPILLLPSATGPMGGLVLMRQGATAPAMVLTAPTILFVATMVIFFRLTLKTALPIGLLEDCGMFTKPDTYHVAFACYRDNVTAQSLARVSLVVELSQLLRRILPDPTSPPNSLRMVQFFNRRSVAVRKTN